MSFAFGSRIMIAKCRLYVVLPVFDVSEASINRVGRFAWINPTLLLHSSRFTIAFFRSSKHLKDLLVFVN